jgi:hypothetical protein
MGHLFNGRFAPAAVIHTRCSLLIRERQQSEAICRQLSAN